MKLSEIRERLNWYRELKEKPDRAEYITDDDLWFLLTLAEKQAKAISVMREALEREGRIIGGKPVNHTGELVCITHCCSVCSAREALAKAEEILK